jgi:hypothetical protein
MNKQQNTGWDDVDEKLNERKRVTIGDVFAWSLIGATLIAGTYQAITDLSRKPQERENA